MKHLALVFVVAKNRLLRLRQRLDSVGAVVHANKRLNKAILKGVHPAVYLGRGVRAAGRVGRLVGLADVLVVRGGRGRRAVVVHRGLKIVRAGAVMTTSVNSVVAIAVVVVVSVMVMMMMVIVVIVSFLVCVVMVMVMVKLLYLLFFLFGRVQGVFIRTPLLAAAGLGSFARAPVYRAAPLAPSVILAIAVVATLRHVYQTRRATAAYADRA